MVAGVPVSTLGVPVGGLGALEDRNQVDVTFLSHLDPVLLAECAGYMPVDWWPLCRVESLHILKEAKLTYGIRKGVSGALGGAKATGTRHVACNWSCVAVEREETKGSRGSCQWPIEEGDRLRIERRQH